MKIIKPSEQLRAAFFIFQSITPGEFAIAPQTPDSAEQIEVRAVYLEKNELTGVYIGYRNRFDCAVK